MLFSARECNFLFAGSLAQNIGTIQNSALSITLLDCIIDGWQGGLTVNAPSTRVLVDRCQFSSDGTGTGAAITVGATMPKFECIQTEFVLANGEKLFAINASLSGIALLEDITNSNTNSSFFDTGLDQTNPKVKVRDCPPQADSQNIGSCIVSNNATNTVINTVNTWTDLNLNASAVAGTNIERWSLTNTTTGELRYDGLEPFKGVFTANLSASSVGGTQDFQFRVVKNGSPLSDNVVSERSTSSSTGNSGYISPCTAVNGDLFIMQVQNITGTSDILFKHLSILVK
jgi:hypothetical protein